MFFAAYVGSSMNPTLREPEMMEVVPYGDRPVHIGDVVYFQPPGTDQAIVHRVVRMTPAGISTRGDNNAQADSGLLRSENLQGQVVAAWRGQQRRKIAGGLRGRLTGRGLRWGLGLCRGVSPVLNPLYQTLSRRGWIARGLPASFRPRVVVFRVQGWDQYQLLLGKRVIGRYDGHWHQWQIQRPFHLLVDGRTLPGKPNPGQSDRQVLTERCRTRVPPRTPAARHALVLADGTRWEIAAGDDEAAAIVSQLGAAMQLRQTTGAFEPAPSGNPCQLLVHVAARPPMADRHVPAASKNGGQVAVCLDPCANWGGPFFNLVRLSLIFAREAQARGGILIHGALAEKNGRGVILAAPGGTGKTTASNRLPAPWRSLCDDTTLVVRDPQGRYWAHPWPTWSRFQKGGPGGTWDVQRAVPLRGIFILVQAAEDRLERLGPGHAASLLVESVKQASQLMRPGLFREEICALHLEGFDNLCALARVMPTHVLHISLTGPFWKEMEPVVAGGSA